MKLEVLGASWKFVPASDRTGSWQLRDLRRNETLAVWGWARLNKVSEADALNEKCRFHEKIDGSEVLIESQNIYPFGGESVIDRTFTVRDKLIEVRVDVKPGRGEAVRSFALEELFLPGEFEKIEVIRFPETAGGSLHLEPLPLDGNIVYDAAAPWAVLLLTYAGGGQLELGIGGDYWRMKGAGAVRNLVEKSAEGITLKSQLVDWSAEEVVERRPWRFNYYLAWAGGFAGTLPPDKDTVFIQPDLLKEVRSSCFRAPAVRKYLRKLIRQQQENSGSVVLQLPDVEVCADAGHLERPGKKELLHWDLDELFALYSWGNRQLGGGRSLQIVLPEKSVFRKLPGGRYLNNVPGGVTVREA